MPIHDWSRVRANRFHDFHQGWTVGIRRALNAGLLPAGYMALIEQEAHRPHFATLSLPIKPDDGPPAGLSRSESPPQVRFQTQADATRYAEKANRIVLHHPDGDMVAVIEIVSPGTRTASTRSDRSLVRRRGIFALAFTF